jgi:hypothetical protein
MKHQYVSPPMAAALNALEERIERAQAERDAYHSEITPPGAKLARKPDGSWVALFPEPPKEAPDA